jgi:hypothetical protein
MDLRVDIMISSCPSSAEPWRLPVGLQLEVSSEWRFSFIVQCGEVALWEAELGPDT